MRKRYLPLCLFAVLAFTCAVPAAAETVQELYLLIWKAFGLSLRRMSWTTI